MPIPSYMTIAKIAGATRVLAEDQDEYQALSIRDELQPDGNNMMVSEWKPDETQLKELAAGGSVYLGILGIVHPPVILAVAPASPPEEPENEITCG